MKKLWAVIEVLYHGRQLANVERWKNIQGVSITMQTIVGGLLALSPEDLNITPDGIEHIALSITMIGSGIVNAYLVPATSAKIGIKPKRGEN